MLSQVETQILLADILAVFCMTFATIVAVTLIDLALGKASDNFKAGAFIVFVMVVILCIKPLMHMFSVMDEYFRVRIGIYDVSDLVEPMRRLIKSIRENFAI